MQGEEGVREEGLEAIEFMTGTILQVGLLYFYKALELTIFLHFSAISQQFQVRRGQGALAEGGQALSPAAEAGITVDRPNQCWYFDSGYVSIHRR